MRILLLSAYDAVSHRLWRQRLAALFPEHQWQQLALPPRHFEWRMRSNSLHWGLGQQAELEQGAELLIATSMVDLAALRGLRPALARIPTLLYFHENQFFYPENSEQANRPHDNIEPKLVPIYSALCADAIVFNSEFNRRSFLEGAARMFRKLPDTLPDSAWRKLQSATVIPVPVATEYRPPGPRPSAEHLEIIWNHRWEYDKGPEILLAVARQLLDRKAALRLHVCGQQFRRQPRQFAELQDLGQQLATLNNLEPGRIGFLDDWHYRQLLQQGDVVLSTAWHEFQGLGIQEASLAGCCPLAPNDLAYPEYLPAQCLYERGSDELTTAATIVTRLETWQQMKRRGEPLPQPSMAAFCGEQIRLAYEECFSRLLQQRS